MHWFFRAIRAMFVLWLMGMAVGFAVAYYTLPAPAWRGLMCMVQAIAYDDEAKGNLCFMAIKEDMIYVPLNEWRANAFANSGKYSEAIVDYTRVVVRSPLSADAFYNRGVSHSALGNVQMAIADYTSAIAIRPNLASAYKNRGIAFFRLKEYQKAILDFTQFLKSEPGDSSVLSSRGAAHYGLNQYQLSIADHTRAIEHGPMIPRCMKWRDESWLP